MTKKLDGHLFKTLKKKKIDPQTENSEVIMVKDTHKISLSLFAPDLSITDNQSRRTAGRLFSLWGVCSDRSGGKSILSKWGFRCSNERFSSWGENCHDCDNILVAIV